MNQVGIGTRVLNFVVDTLLVFALSFAVFKGWEFYAYYWHIVYIPFYYFFWGILFLYYLIFESLFKRSPAKWITLTRVVSKNGGRPSLGQIFIRSLIRLTLVDCFFIPFIGETLHDYLSRTAVVEA